MAPFCCETWKIGLLDFTRQNTRRLKFITALSLIFLFSLADPTLGLAAKRVGVVYSETSANQFYDKFSYSQFFMAMQHQAMMAGIPFDLLTEQDLTSSVDLTSYDALIISPMEHAADEAAVAQALQTAVDNGVGMITAGVLLSVEATEQIMGVRYTGSINGAASTVTAAAAAHPILRDYTPNEEMADYSALWFGIYEPVDAQNAVTLANIQADNNTYNGTIAVAGSSRRVYFANDQLMGDTNLVWPALMWVVYGDQTPVGLKLGRHQSIFVGRNDMDSSMYAEELELTEIPLLDLLIDWKEAYNFVGSYYINIGNRPRQGEFTDWSISGPLYQEYIRYGNEIGTHSYTHPDYTSELSASQLEFQFNQSKLEIEANLGIYVSGAAVPGNPETLEVDWQLNNYFDYLSGRYSYTGSGYPSAFGYLTPDYDMLYYSLNMSPDFTLIGFLGYTPQEASQIWFNEYNRLLNHTSQPIIHWLWHDYAPTIESDIYTVDLFENLIATAYHGGSEFATGDDIRKRIRAFQYATFDVEENGALTVNVTATEVGQFSLQVTSDQVISRVDNWYAYDEDQVFLPQEGGQFTIRQGTSQSGLTRITALPMRAKLIGLEGDGTELSFTFEGEGAVVVELNPAIVAAFDVQGAGSTSLNGTTLTLNFNTYGEHSAAIVLDDTTNQAPTAQSQALSTPADASLAILLAAGDPNGDTLTYSVISAPQNGTLSGTPPQLSYAPNAGFVGSDSFDFTVSDGQLTSSPATITISVTEVNLPPVGNAQTLNMTAGETLAITLTASDPNGDALTLSVVSEPTNGSLSGTPPQLTYTPDAGFSGDDTFTFTADDGALESEPAAVNITVAPYNQTPTANSQSLTTAQDTPVAILLTASDPDGDALTLQVATPPVNGSLSGNAPSLTYTPDAGFSGTDSFTFTADDGLAESPAATIVIAVSPADGSEISNSADNISVDGDLTDWAALVSFGSDPDDISDSGQLDWREAWMAHDDTNFYLAVQNDADISLSWAYNIYIDTDGSTATGFHSGGAFPVGAEYLFQGGYLYQYSGDGSSWSWSYVAALAHVVSGPNAEFIIPRSSLGHPTALQFFFLGDNTAYAAGALTDLYPDQALTDGATGRFLAYTVTPSANQAPTANSQSLTTSVETPLAIVLTANDPDGDPLVLTITSTPINGVLSGTAPEITYTPDSGFSGTDSFTFTAGDGLLESQAATISITVTPTGGSDGEISNYSNNITIDGTLTDWVTLTSFGTDPDDVGDSSLLDWREAWMAHDDANLYLALRNDSDIVMSWAYNLYLDTDGSDATGYHGGSLFPIGAEYLLQGGYLYQYTGDGSSWSWSFVATLTQAVNAAEAEFVIPRSALGDPQQLSLFFYGENSAYASDAPSDLYPDQALDAAGENRYFQYVLR